MVHLLLRKGDLVLSRDRLRTLAYRKSIQNVYSATLKCNHGERMEISPFEREKWRVRQFHQTERFFYIYSISYRTSVPQSEKMLLRTHSVKNSVALYIFWATTSTKYMRLWNLRKCLKKRFLTLLWGHRFFSSKAVSHKRLAFSWCDGKSWWEWVKMMSRKQLDWCAPLVLQDKRCSLKCRLWYCRCCCCREVVAMTSGFYFIRFYPP